MALWWKRTEDEHRLSMAELEKENDKLHKQIEALEQQAAFHEGIFMEIADVIYA